MRFRAIIEETIGAAGESAQIICEDKHKRSQIFGSDYYIVTKFCGIQGNFCSIDSGFENGDGLCCICISNDPENVVFIREHDERHQFHENCIAEWLYRPETTCPLCKAEFNF